MRHEVDQPRSMETDVSCFAVNGTKSSKGVLEASMLDWGRVAGGLTWLGLEPRLILKGK